MDEIKMKTEAGTAQGPALPVDSVRLQEFDQTLHEPIEHAFEYFNDDFQIKPPKGRYCYPYIVP